MITLHQKPFQRDERGYLQTSLETNQTKRGKHGISPKKKKRAQRQKEKERCNDPNLIFILMTFNHLNDKLIKLAPHFNLAFSLYSYIFV